MSFDPIRALAKRLPSWRALALLIIAAFVVSAAQAQRVEPVNVRALLARDAAETLSAYRLFTDARARTPNGAVTPYAINTHRLLVRGERTEYIPPEELAEQNAVHEVQSQTITKRIVDVWPWLVVSLLIVAGVEGSIFLLIVKRQRSYGDVREKRKKGKRSSRSCNKTRHKK